ncbi:hypothetical protein ABTX81_28415 [Kitasatospora sp. NPDC097605]|uniref:hypothetical protein n=1 Tax=Kitasatospora sp. NPDC097605 TaxID=3157226 RepID=UPI003316BA9A
MRTRVTITGLALGTVLLGGGLAAPAAQAATTRTEAVTCKTLSASVTNSAGSRGGHVQGTFCIAASSAYLNDAYNNFVQDDAADGVAARAYVTASGITNGPLATDSTSTAGGTSLGPWESTDPGVTSVRLWVCLGTAFPGSSGARCGSAVMSG